jgi:hypothetical protein
MLQIKATVFGDEGDEKRHGAGGDGDADFFCSGFFLSVQRYGQDVEEDNPEPNDTMEFNHESGPSAPFVDWTCANSVVGGDGYC